MRYATSFKTYRPDDCTSTGWLVESHACKARLTRRTRWQGSRDNIVVVKAIDTLLTDDQARDMAEELDELISSGRLTIRRGEECDGFLVVSTGYIVR